MIFRRLTNLELHTLIDVIQAYLRHLFVSEQGAVGNANSLHSQPYNIYLWLVGGLVSIHHWRWFHALEKAMIGTGGEDDFKKFCSLFLTKIYSSELILNAMKIDFQQYKLKAIDTYIIKSFWVHTFIQLYWFLVSPLFWPLQKNLITFR